MNYKTDVKIISHYVNNATDVFELEKKINTVLSSSENWIQDGPLVAVSKNLVIQKFFRSVLTS